jgi:MFS family permease
MADDQSSAEVSIPDAAKGGAFRAFRNHNYRIWAGGAAVSNVGAWMQRTAQDWLVLTALTRNDASAVGVVMALQFGPQFLLLPWTGVAADQFDRRKLIMATQAVMGVLALALGVLTISGRVELWHVQVFALLFGCASAFDTPVRQTFVADLVGDEDLPNAVAWNSTSFNGARLVGPAVAGVCIAAIGTGWAFIANGVSFLAVLASLALLRRSELKPSLPAKRQRGALVEGVRCVARRRDLTIILVMLFVIGTFGFNFPIFISTMAVNVFHVSAHEFGLLSSLMAVGAVGGALLATGRRAQGLPVLAAGAAVFALGCAFGAIAPGYWTFGAALILMGFASMSMTTVSSTVLQLSSEPSMRGRVMALRLAVIMGTTPLGAPIVGWVADNLGPRWALGVGAAAGLVTAAIGWAYLRRAARPSTGA